MFIAKANSGLIVIVLVLMLSVTFLLVNACPSYADEDLASSEILLSGTYDDVPYKITDDGELIFGEDGKEYTFNRFPGDETSRWDYPWAYADYNVSAQ